MTECEKLIEIISQGYQAQMILRTITLKEMKSRQLSEYYWDKIVYGLPLVNYANGQKIMFYMVEDETIEFVKKLVDEAKSIIGYKPTIYCSAISAESINGKKIIFTNVIESLKKIKGWNIQESKYPNTIEVKFNIEGNNNTTINDLIDEVEQVLLLLSIKNKIGINISKCSHGELYKGQPFSITFGLQESLLKGLDENDLNFIEIINNNKLCFSAAKSLQLIYSQISNSSKLTICWATIEHIFSNKPQHLLKKEEIKLTCDKINELPLSEKKKTKIIEIIRSPNLLSEKNRNERIALSICDMLDREYDEILNKIKKLTKDRGKMVHALGNDAEIIEHIKFVEDILNSYILKHCGITFK